MMKISEKINIAVLLALGSITTAQANELQNNSSFEVSADIVAGCILNAQNLNFGILQMPIVDQSAQSSMSVLCSKGAAYNIDVSYSNIGSSSGGDYIVIEGSDGAFSQRFNSAQGNTFIECNTKEPNKVHLWSFEFASSIGASMKRIGWNNDNLGLCGGTGHVNVGIMNGLGYSTSANGAMIGMSSGEKVVYSIKNPSNSNPLTSSNKFSAIGTGQEEIVPLVANIKSSQNATHRMTPDTYQDTVNLILSY